MYSDRVITLLYAAVLFIGIVIGNLIGIGITASNIEQSNSGESVIYKTEDRLFSECE